MNRETFIKTASLSVASFLLYQKLNAMSMISPISYHFKDDGLIPNSKYPLLVYKNAFEQRGNEGGNWLEEHFTSNSWTNTWRWGVYPFHHFHSNTHEVLGVFSGNALLHMGGEQGQKFEVKAGDILVIPAGVGHKCLLHSHDFTVLGAYPNGLKPDLMKGQKADRPQVDHNIANVVMPAADPYAGGQAGLIELWK